MFETVEAGEARPGEVDVAVEPAAGAIGLDRGLVVELAGERSRRTRRHRDRADVALAVVGRAPARVHIGRDPLVAESLRASAGIAGALRTEERASMTVPRDHRIAGAGCADVRQCRERRGVARIARNQRALEAGSGILGAVVTEPNRAGRITGGGVAGGPEHAAIVVRATQDYMGVARVNGHGRLVLASPCDRAFLQDAVGIGLPGGKRVRAHIATAVVVCQPYVAARRRGRAAGRHHEG